MLLVSLMKHLAKYLAFELIAVLGAVVYVTLSNSLPETGAQALAGLILIALLAALIYGFVRVIKNLAGAIRNGPQT